MKGTMKIFIYISIILITLPVFAEDSGEIIIKVENIKEEKGKIYCSIHDKAKGFPRDAESQMEGEIVEVNDVDSVYVSFEKIPYGKYAISLFHDSNDNGKMDYNLFGIPKEGYGMSNNPEIKMSVPSFEECSFELETRKHQITVRLNH
ncbi:MAG: DUF2141 domain-containing protein [Candidatus Zixiibacteriota bacterium]